MTVFCDETVRDRILEAIVTALVGLAEEIVLEPPGDPSCTPAISIFDQGDRLVEREAMLTRWSMSIVIESFVDGAAGRAPAAARNRLDAAIVAALMADEQFGGLVELVEPGDRRNFTAALASIYRLGCAREFEIQFTALRVDPARAA